MELLELSRRWVAVVLRWPQRPAAIDELPEMPGNIFVEDRRVALGGGDVQVPHHLGEDVHGEPGSQRVRRKQSPEIVRSQTSLWAVEARRSHGVCDEVLECRRGEHPPYIAVFPLKQSES